MIRNVNPAALSRVYANIISNAIKYSSGDFSVNATEEGVISFTNSSDLLDEIQVGRLFDRFFTVETAHQSTGLGLSIARDLVDRMGGKVSARYQDGKLNIELFFE